MPCSENDNEANSEDLEHYRTTEGVYSFSPDDDEETREEDFEPLGDVALWDDHWDDYEDEYESVALRPIPPARQPPSPACPMDNSLYHDGTNWWVTYAGKTAKLRNLDGLLYLSYALEQPGLEGIRLLDIEMLVHANVVVYDYEADGPTAFDAEALLVEGGFDDEEPDTAMLRSVSYSEVTATEARETLAGYRYALQQLNRQIQEARGQGQTTVVQHIREQKRHLEAELRSVENQAKRGPENEGPSKSHITRIRNAINYAKDTAIPKAHPAFAWHLQQYLTCESNSVIYIPPEPVRWSIQRPQ